MDLKGEEMKERCKQWIGCERMSDLGPHRCLKPVWKDGYCKIHHPDLERERLKKQKAKKI